MAGTTYGILLPVCNESAVIREVLNEWVEQVKVLPPGSKIYIEDANSTDGTREIIQEIETKNSALISSKFHHNRDGFKNALIRLFEAAETDYFFVADTDGQYLVSDFPLFVEKARNGDEFVKGVKINRKDGFFRRLFSFLMNRFIVVFLGLPFLDYNSSHYLIKKDLLDRINLKNLIFTYSINVEITLRSIFTNCKYSIIYIKHKTRKQGTSRGNPPQKFLKYGFVTIKEIWKLKSDF